ncbi:spore germination protein, partial [Klebsiella pneumoniae]
MEYKNKQKPSTPEQQDKGGGDSPKTPLYSSLQMNIKHTRDTLGNSNDIVIREIQIGKGIDVGIFYTDGLADSKSINNFIMETLMLDFQWEESDSQGKNILF